MASVAISYC